MTTYSVIRNSRPGRGKGKNTTVASGRPLAEAKQIRDQLQKQENEAHPEKTSWTRDVFVILLEQIHLVKKAGAK